MAEYNTSKPALILKEYGRNIQKLVEYVGSIEDRDKRNHSAATLAELMKQISPDYKESPENNQKVWDDMFIMAGFELDIDSPYPKPSPDVLDKKPERVPYQNNRIRFKHYGRNIELLVQEAIAKEDPQEREAAIIYIGKLMKSFYATWNAEVIEDDIILDNIKTISNGELSIDLGRVKEDNLFEKLYKEKKKSRPSGKPGKRGPGGGGRRRRN